MNDEFTPAVYADAPNNCWFIPSLVFEEVQHYVEANEAKLKSLMVSESPGTVKYWEEDHHNRIVEELYQKWTSIVKYKKSELKTLKSHISNSLSAFGY